MRVNLTQVYAGPIRRFIALIVLGATPFVSGFRPAKLIALSPDGTRLVYVGQGMGRPQLFLRSLPSGETLAINGTEGGAGPAFSPDGKWIAFEADGKLKKIPTRGGTAITICEGSRIRGVTWGVDDTIVFSTPTSPLLRVPAAGGTAQPITSLDASKKDGTHRWPMFLPGGTHILFSIANIIADYDRGRIAVLDLRSGKWRTVLEGGYHGRVSPTGHLLYVQWDTLFAIPFDLERLEVHDSPVLIARDVHIDSSAGTANFVVAANGAVSYVPRNPVTSELKTFSVPR